MSGFNATCDRLHMGFCEPPAISPHQATTTRISAISCLPCERNHLARSVYNSQPSASHPRVTLVFTKAVTQELVMVTASQTYLARKIYQYWVPTLFYRARSVCEECTHSSSCPRFVRGTYVTSHSRTAKKECVQITTQARSP